MTSSNSQISSAKNLTIYSNARYVNFSLYLKANLAVGNSVDPIIMKLQKKHLTLKEMAEKLLV